MQFHFTLSTTLAFALALFSHPLAVSMDMPCFTLAVMRYFASLATVFWKTCVAGDTWWAMRRSRACQKLQETASIKRYLFVGWLLPLILTIVPLSIDLLKADTDLAPQFGGSGCWITQPLSLVFFFFVPFFISCIINVTLVVLTLRTLKTSLNNPDIESLYHLCCDSWCWTSELTFMIRYHYFIGIHRRVNLGFYSL